MNDEGSAAVGSHEGVRTAAMCCAVGSNYIPMEGAAAARTCWPAENGLARIACKILCCSFSSIGRSSFRRSEQQSEGKHTTETTVIAGAFLLLEIPSRHCRDMAQRMPAKEGY